MSNMFNKISAKFIKTRRTSEWAQRAQPVDLKALAPPLICPMYNIAYIASRALMSEVQIFRHIGHLDSILFKDFVRK